MDPNLYNATIGAPAASPNILGASMYNEIANKGAIDRKLPTTVGLAGEHIGTAEEKIEAQKAAEKAKALEEQKKADLADATKYRKVKKDDGGFDFFDPDGKQLDIATLTQRTGTRATDWINDSENPIDIQYREDSASLEDYMNAKLSGDKKKADEYEKTKPELAKYQGKGGAHQLMEDFRNYYKRFYTPSAWGERPNDGAYIPRSSSEEDDLEIGL